MVLKPLFLFIFLGFAGLVKAQVIPKETSPGKQEPADKGEIKISPNPTTGDTFLSFHLEKGSTVEISVVNAIGKKFKQVSINQYFHEGHNTVQLKTEGLLPGMYFVEVNVNNTKSMKRLYVTSS